MCKVKQKECIFNQLEAKTDLTYFPKILQFTEMLGDLEDSEDSESGSRNLQISNQSNNVFKVR